MSRFNTGQRSGKGYGLITIPNSSVGSVVINVNLLSKRNRCSSCNLRLQLQVADARKMHFDYSTPVIRSSRRGCESKRPATPNPKHVWNSKRSRLTSEDIAELKAPILRKMRCQNVAASLRSQVTTTMP